MSRAIIRGRWTATVAVGIAAALVAPTPAAAAPAPSAPVAPATAPDGRTGTDHPAVVSWIRQHAHPTPALPSGHAPPGSLRPLQDIADGAVVVGLGASAEGTREFGGATQAIARYLVTDMGFRTIAIEDDWTAGILLNRYVLRGQGNLRDIVPQLAPRFRTHRMAQFVRWVRRYNCTHRDPVRFFGSDATSTRTIAYDIVADYVAAAAPHRLDELQRYYAVIRPTTDAIWDYNEHFYQDVRDKQRYVDLARRAYRLVADLPADHDDSGYQRALHGARIIKAYYTIAAVHPPNYRDALMASSIGWSRHRHHNRVIYIAASLHVAVDADARLSYPPHPTQTISAAGSHLHRRYGDRYTAIALTFGGGSVTSGLAQGRARQYPVSAPRPGTDGYLLSQTHWRCYLLDLDQHAPAAVDDWLRSPSRLRAISTGSFDPARADDFAMSGGSLRQWFDALVHVRRITAVHLLR